MQATFRAACALLVLALVLTAACTPSKPAAPPPSPYWGGDLTPVVSVKELMRDLIDPLSDNIFLSVGTRVSAAGVEEWAPKTDEDWNKVRVGAVVMAEASYLLKVPRPFAPPGDENNSKGPDAAELSPAQIKEKLERDPVLWQAKVEALRNVGRQVLDIVERRDASALEDAAENLDNACETCHLEFWYPGQVELMKRLGR
ncbi:MAG: hypothetical protein Q7J25_02475 [Vicinamibacterales bacterium]|nr:hypothetical protein [Vicinamibacterales bacterium]